MSCATNHAFDAAIRTAAEQWSIDPALLKAHVNRESAFSPTAYRYEANVGDASYGLAQVRFAVAKGLGYPGGPDGLYDAGTNLFYAAKLIRQNLDYARGDLATATSAYNAGFGNPPARTGRRASDGRFINQGYVDGVLACIQAYAGDFTLSEPPVDSGGPPPVSSPGVTKLLTIVLAALAGLVTVALIIANRRP
jgi:soluble lytic murein transglycosylase-like protein